MERGSGVPSANTRKKGKKKKLTDTHSATAFAWARENAMALLRRLLPWCLPFLVCPRLGASQSPTSGLLSKRTTQKKATTRGEDQFDRAHTDEERRKSEIAQNVGGWERGGDFPSENGVGEWDAGTGEKREPKCRKSRSIIKSCFLIRTMQPHMCINTHTHTHTSMSHRR